MQDQPSFETIKSDQRDVTCDGGPMAHPKIYLHIGKKNSIICPYCSRCYVLEQTEK